MAAVDVPRDMHMVKIISDESGQRKSDKMNSNILDNFNNLKDSNDSVRLNAGITLLNYLRERNTVYLLTLLSCPGKKEKDLIV